MNKSVKIGGVMNRPPASDRALERARRMIKGDIIAGRPDPDGLRELIRAVFPGEDVGDPRFLPWLYDQNPAGRALEVSARSRSLVMGHIAALPMRYKIGGGSVAGCVFVNAMTHPDFRGRGIFMVLHEETLRLAEASGIAFSFGFANRESERGCFRHLGYQELTRIPLWVLPLNLPRVLAALPAKGGIGWRVAARAGRPFLGVWRSLHRPRRYRSVDVETIGEFGPEFDVFWTAASSTAENILIRDRAFLNWRFALAPTRRCDLFAARSGGRLLGYLAGRTVMIEGLRWGLIVDLLTEDSDAGRSAATSLVAAYNRHVLGRGADVAATLMPAHAPQARALRRNGYVVGPPALLPREFPALVRWRAQAPPPPRFLDPKAWFLTLADYDAV